MSSFQPGDNIEALGCDGKWAKATIVTIQDDKLTVNFTGWTNKWNETLPSQKVRKPVTCQATSSRPKRQNNRYVNPELLVSGRQVHTNNGTVVVSTNDPFNRVIETTDGLEISYNDLLKTPSKLALRHQSDDDQLDSDSDRESCDNDSNGRHADNSSGDTTDDEVSESDDSDEISSRSMMGSQKGHR